jgi:hypothetical protein
MTIERQPGAARKSTCRAWLFLGSLLLLAFASPAPAQISVGIGVPSLDIGIHLPALPSLTVVPGSPVYYAPSVDGNFFFYDGMYWVFDNDNWYSSSWYNGPWALVDSDIVPNFLLQVPVRYYRRPPTFFRGWAANAPPRWDEHWGNGWAQKHGDWNKRVDRGHVPPAAPIPSYQKQYAGKRYPTVQQQPALHSQNYKYQPREPVVQQHYQQHAAAPQSRGEARPGQSEKGEEHKK